jgi:hypothetical protein
MPHCENNCGNEVGPGELYEDRQEGTLICEECAGKVPLVAVPHGTKLLGRTLEYGVSYTSDDGLKAHARLGGARLALTVEPGELNKLFGTEE